MSSVTQRQGLSKAQREQIASDELAERLERLTTPMADRILGRAVALDHELQEEAEKAASTMDYETLKNIALEVGISEEALKKAILEEFDTEKDRNPTPLEKATVPDAVRGGLIVASPFDEMLEKIQQSLGIELHPSQRPDGTIVIDLNNAKTAMRRGGPAATVRTWSVPQRDRDRHLVEVDVDTKRDRKRAWRWIIGLLILGSIFGSNIGGLFLFGIWIVGMVTAVSWMNRIRRKAARFINRLLNDIVGGDSGDTPEWLDLWERSGK